MEKPSMMQEVVNNNDWPAFPADPILANAYVPLQRYEQLFSPAQALLQGSLFQELVLPYRNSVNSGDLKDCLLADLQAVCFAAHDLALFLNTHAYNAEALKYYRELIEARQDLVEAYEREFGPLTAQDAAFTSTERWDWVDEPWPWQKG